MWVSKTWQPSIKKGIEDHTQGYDQPEINGRIELWRQINKDALLYHFVEKSRIKEKDDKYTLKK